MGFALNGRPVTEMNHFYWYFNFSRENLLNPHVKGNSDYTTFPSLQQNHPIYAFCYLLSSIDPNPHKKINLKKKGKKLGKKKRQSKTGEMPHQRQLLFFMQVRFLQIPWLFTSLVSPIILCICIKVCKVGICIQVI